MLRRICTVIVIVTLLGIGTATPVRASIAMLSLAKTITVANHDSQHTNVVTTATVAHANDSVNVVITVTNSSGQPATLTIRDTFQDAVSGAGFTTLDTSGAGWYVQGGQVIQKVYTGAVPCAGNQICDTVTIPASATAPWEFRYAVKSPQLPTYKPRLIAFPLQSDANGASAFPVVDVGYALFVPDAGNITNITATSFSTTENNVAEYDLGIIVPGVNVTIANGALNEVTQKTSDTFAYIPFKGTTALGTDANARKCLGSALFFTSRGGSCVYSSKATVSVAGEGQEDSSVASLMVLPSSAIVGSVFVNGAASAANILLPGTHISSGFSGSTASQNVNNASIDQNSVSGWKAGDVYKNVYANSNIQRLTRNADIVLSKNQFVQKPIVTTTFGITCKMESDGSACLADVNQNGRAVFTIKGSSDPQCPFYLDLSNTTNLGSCANSKPASDRKNGYVLYVDGSLDIEANGGTIDTLKNVAGGSIIVNGNLTINNVSIDYSVTNPNVVYQKKPLAFIVVPTAGVASAVWSVNNNNVSLLNSTVFFVPNGTFSAIKTGSGSLSLLGSIVANVVDLSKAGSATSDTDTSSITIQTDPLVSQFPPPGTNIFSGGASAGDVAP